MHHPALSQRGCGPGDARWQAARAREARKHESTQNSTPSQTTRMDGRHKHCSGLDGGVKAEQVTLNLLTAITFLPLRLLKG